MHYIDVKHDIYSVYPATSVAVGEQGNALQQASLFKGRFGGIVNMFYIIMNVRELSGLKFYFCAHRRCDFGAIEVCEFIYMASIALK